jgi:tetratricopeptide (TPR) repeat protein
LGESVRLRDHAKASVFMIRGKRDRAMDAYRSILASDPADPAALPLVLDDLRRDGKARQAIETAERALAAMPDNFFALDGLAWARIELGEYSQAKAAVEQAIHSLDTLNPGKPIGRLERVAVGVVRFLGSIPGLGGRVPRVPSAAAINADAARGLAEWKRWANDYLTWYDSERGEGAAGGRPTSGIWTPPSSEK